MRLPSDLGRAELLRALRRGGRCGVEITNSILTTGAEAGAVLPIPINRFEGNYTVGPETLAELQGEHRLVLRYVENPNGSVHDSLGPATRTATLSVSGDNPSGHATSY